MDGPLPGELGESESLPGRLPRASAPVVRNPERGWLGLDSPARLVEITSGVVLTLTLLVGAGWVIDDSRDPHELLFGVLLGANLAAGFTAGILAILEDLYLDAQRRRAIAEMRNDSPEAAREKIRERIADQYEVVLSDDIVEEVREFVIASARPKGLRLDDLNLRDALSALVLNLLALLPVTLVALFVPDWHTSMYVAEGMLVAMLFVTGLYFGRRASLSPLACGLTLTVLGLALVALGFVLEGA